MGQTESHEPKYDSSALGFVDEIEAGREEFHEETRILGRKQELDTVYAIHRIVKELVYLDDVTIDHWDLDLLLRVIGEDYCTMRQERDYSIPDVEVYLDCVLYMKDVIRADAKYRCIPDEFRE